MDCKIHEINIVLLQDYDYHMPNQLVGLIEFLVGIIGLIIGLPLERKMMGHIILVVVGMVLKYLICTLFEHILYAVLKTIYLLLKI
jgi:hypothetical protein